MVAQLLGEVKAEVVRHAPLVPCRPAPGGRRSGAAFGNARSGCPALGALQGNDVRAFRGGRRSARTSFSEQVGSTSDTDAVLRIALACADVDRRRALLLEGNDVQRRVLVELPARERDLEAGRQSVQPAEGRYTPPIRQFDPPRAAGASPHAPRSPGFHRSAGRAPSPRQWSAPPGRFARLLPLLPTVPAIHGPSSGPLSASPSSRPRALRQARPLTLPCRARRASVFSRVWGRLAECGRGGSAVPGRRGASAVRD